MKAEEMALREKRIADCLRRAKGAVIRMCSMGNKLIELMPPSTSKGAQSITDSAWDVFIGEHERVCDLFDAIVKGTCHDHGCHDHDHDRLTAMKKVDRWIKQAAEKELADAD